MGIVYSSKKEYINSGKFSHLLSAEVKQAMELIVVKRNGIYSIRKTRPNRSNPKALAIFNAWKVARHHANWGDLVAWDERVTMDLMSMPEAERELFHSAIDQFCECQKASLGARYGKAWGA